MTVKHLLLGFHIYDIEGDGYEPIGNILDATNKKKVDELFMLRRKHFFNTLFMDSNAKTNPPDDEHATWYAIGDPTEAALVSLAGKTAWDIEKLDSTYQEIHQYGFDSVRKMMSSIRMIDKQKIIYVK